MVIHKDMFDKTIEDEKPTVMVSGGFDPVHVGHIRMIREAAKYGDVIVVANSDEWLYRKKGFNFMDFESRREILDSIKRSNLGRLCRRIPMGLSARLLGATDQHTLQMVVIGVVVILQNKNVCESIGVELLWGIGRRRKSCCII